MFPKAEAALRRCAATTEAGAARSASAQGNEKKREGGLHDVCFGLGGVDWCWSCVGGDGKDT